MPTDWSEYNIMLKSFYSTKTTLLVHLRALRSFLQIGTVMFHDIRRNAIKEMLRLRAFVNSYEEQVETKSSTIYKLFPVVNHFDYNGYVRVIDNHRYRLAIKTIGELHEVIHDLCIT
jgi:hypothetical protein